MFKFLKDVDSKRERIAYALLFCNMVLVFYLTEKGMNAFEQAALIGAVGAGIGWYMQKETERKSTKEVQ